MVKVNIISGFLGAGKTTLIKKLLTGSVAKEKIILLENEYGEVGVDGSFMKDSGIIVDELNSGCICCTLVGDFQKAVDDLIAKYHPDRLLIEPSGVGKLSEILAAVERAEQIFAGRLKNVDDEYIRERSVDVCDVCRRVVDILDGRPRRRLHSPSSMNTAAQWCFRHFSATA